MKTSDWSSCEEHWKECIRKMETSKKRILEKGIPPFYIKLLASMEDTLNGLNKEALKKMKPAVGKAAANLKTVIKKHNLTYQTDISDFRQNPDKYESASEEDSDSDSDSESGSDDSDSDSDEDEKPVTKAVSAKKTTKVSHLINRNGYVMYCARSTAVCAAMLSCVQLHGGLAVQLQ